MDIQNIRGLMMQRQCLGKPVKTKEEYKELFRLMQPVTPIYFSRPGDPPCLVHRADFDDRLHNDILRGNRDIVKARFQGGNVGYVAVEDLELYIAAFKKPIEKLTFKQKYILDVITHTGPLGCKQIKEETGILNKDITPVLHRLQEAFLVYEDQVDSEWDRAWYNFESEWYDIDINKYQRKYAIAQILLRFLKCNVFSDIQGMKDWFKLPAKDIKEAVKELEESHDIVQAEVDGVQGFLRKDDVELLSSEKFSISPSVYMLHRSDFLVKSNESMLKERFKNHEVLQYLLIDGEFKGAVLGHWRIGPYDVDDIILELSEQDKLERKREIINAVSVFYKSPFSNILKYDGKTV